MSICIKLISIWTNNMRSSKKNDLTKLRAVIDSNKCDKLRECFVSVSELANTLKDSFMYLQKQSNACLRE